MHTTRAAARPRYGGIAAAVIVSCWLTASGVAGAQPLPWRIYSVAGTGELRTARLGGPATRAGVGSPAGVAALPDGGFLVADIKSDRVLRVLADGRVIVVAGDGRDRDRGDGGPATQASLNGPGPVAALPDGSFLIGTVSRVRMVTPDGRITTVAGTGRGGVSGDGGPAIAARIIGPQALATLPGGGFLMENDNRIRKVAADGTISTVAGSDSYVGSTRDGQPALGANLGLGDYTNAGLLALADGSFVFSEPDKGRIRRVTPDGTLTTIPGGRATKDPEDLALAPDGGMYVVEGAGPIYINRIAPDGTVDRVAGGFDRWFAFNSIPGRGTGMLNGDGRPALGALFGGSDGMKIDATAEGGLLIAETEGGRARYMAPPGTAYPAAAIVRTRVAHRRVTIDVRTTVAGRVRARALRGSRVVATRTVGVRQGVRRLTLRGRRAVGLLAVQVLVDVPGHAPLYDEVGLISGDLAEPIVRKGLRRYNSNNFFPWPIGRCHRWTARRIDCPELYEGARGRGPCIDVAAVVARRSGIPGALTYSCLPGRPRFILRAPYDYPRKRHPLLLLDPRTPLPRVAPGGGR